MSVYLFHTDPGHGWLEVSVEECNRLDITDRVTGYSYVSTDLSTLYLEEDMDAVTFYDAKKARDEPIEFREVHGGEWIRDLPRVAGRVS